MAAIETVELTKTYGPVIAVDVRARDRDDALNVGGVLSVPLLIVGIVASLPAAGVAGGSQGDGLSWGGAVAVLVVWALVFNVLGLIAEKRRDID